MKNKAVLLTGLFILFIKTLTFSQETSFNNKNGGLFCTQFMAIIDAPRISPIIGYKLGRIVYFTGYENIKYSMWDSNRNGLKAGVYIYPFKNLRKVKVYYQALVSYKWHKPEEQTKMYFFHSGSGLDYFFRDNISIGYDLNIGWGKMKDSYSPIFKSTFDWNSTISLKLFLF